MAEPFPTVSDLPDEPPRIHVSARGEYHLSAAFFQGADFAAARALEYFQSVESQMLQDVRGRMRLDLGAEREDARTQTVGGMNPSLHVFGTLVQSFVDETGAHWTDKMPPWDRESGLYGWVGRHLQIDWQPPQNPRNPNLTDEERRIRAQEWVTYRLAKAIFERGLPAPSDYLHRPFGATFDEWQPAVDQKMAEIGFIAAEHMNGVQI